MTLLNDYVILENALDNPEMYINLAKTLEYYNAENNQISEIRIKKDDEHRPTGKWRGHRSNALHEVNYELFRNTFDNLFKKIIGKKYDFSFNYNVLAVFNYSPEFVPAGENKDFWWHKDERSVFAGVIYLNKNPQKNSGTLLMPENKEIEIENVFNRLVMYNSKILHRPESCFGNNLNNTRLTLTFFVNSLEFNNLPPSFNG